MEYPNGLSYRMFYSKNDVDFISLESELVIVCMLQLNYGAVTIWHVYSLWLVECVPQKMQTGNPLGWPYLDSGRFHLKLAISRSWKADKVPAHFKVQLTVITFATD